MANYNTFIAQDIKSGNTLLVTSSARKVKRLLTPDTRVEVWNDNKRIEAIYTQTSSQLDKYAQAESEYIKAKQARRARANDPAIR